MKKTMKYFYLIAIFLIASILASAQNPFPRGLETVFIDPISRTNTELDAMLNIPIGRRAYSSDDQQWKTWNGTTWEQSSATATSIHTFTVEEKSGDFITEVADNSIKIYHSNGSIGDVIFNAEYTDYLEGLNPLIGSQPLQLIIYNITKNKLLTGEIQSLNYRTGGDGSTYFGANIVSDSMAAADIDEGDVVEVQVCVSSDGGGTQTLDETLTLGNSSGQGLDLHTLRYRHYEGNIGSSSYTDINGDYIRARNSLASGEAYTQVSEQGLESKYGATYSLIRPSYQASGTYRLKFPKVDNKTPIMSINGVFADDETGDFTFNGFDPSTDRTISGDWLFDGNVNFDTGFVSFDLGADFSNTKITNLATGTGPNDATNLSQVETLIAGAGDVTKVGTSANNQIAVWTGDGTIKGNRNLTYNGSLLRLNGDSEGSVQIEKDDIILQKGASGNPSIKGGTGQYKTTLIFDTSGMTNNAEITLKNESGVNALISDIDAAIANIPSGGGSANVHSVTQLTDLTGDQSANGNKIWSIQSDIDMGNASITLPTGVYLKDDKGSIINGTIDLNGGIVDNSILNYQLTLQNGHVEGYVYLFDKENVGITEGVVSDAAALLNKQRIQKIFKQAYDLQAKDVVIPELDVYVDVWGNTTSAKENVLAGYAIRLYPDTNYKLSKETYFRVQPTNSLGAKLFVAYLAHNTTVKGGNLIGDRATHDYSPVFDLNGVARHTHGAGSLLGIIGCHNFTVDGTYIAEGHGDGMGVAGTEIRHDGAGGANGAVRDGEFETRNLLISNVTFSQNRRNNVSIVDGFNIKFENCDIEGAGNGYTIIPSETKSDFDGSITTWTLGTVANEGYSLNNELGQILEEGVDYTFDGTTITYTTAPANGVTHNFHYYTAGGYAPRYGIDIEPYRERNASGVELLYEITSNITISTCTFKNNYSGDVNMFKGESVRVVNNQMDNRLVMLFGRENEIVGNTFRYNNNLPLVTPDRVAITATSAIVNNEGVTEEIVYDNTIKDNTIFDFPVGIDVKGKAVNVTGNSIYDPTVVGIHFNGIRDSNIDKNYIEADTAISAFKSSNNYVSNVILDKNNINCPLGIAYDLETVNGSVATEDNRFVISNSIINATTSLKNRSETHGVVYDNNYANCPADVQNLYDFEIKNNTNSNDAPLFWSSIFNLGDGVFENNRVSGNSAILGVIRINATNTANAYLVSDITFRNNYLTKTAGTDILEFVGNEVNFDNIKVLSNYFEKDGTQEEISGAFQNSFFRYNETLGSTSNFNINGTNNSIINH